MLYNKEQVMGFLPHRDPFLFIDSVRKIVGKERELIEGEVVISARDLVGMEVVADYHVKEDLPIFQGHFPGRPILPGVVQVEMMAQSACFVLTRLYGDTLDDNFEVALMGVTDAKFRQPVLPGMDLEIRATCTKTRGSVMSYDCQIYNEGKIMSQASILAAAKV